MHLPARPAGASANALNHAVAQARDEILIFSDAATLFAPDAVAKLARHFADPRVGAVCGSLEFEASAESRQTEGVYWSVRDHASTHGGAARRHADGQRRHLRAASLLLSPAPGEHRAR